MIIGFLNNVINKKTKKTGEKMFKFGKSHISALLALISINSSALMADSYSYQASDNCCYPVANDCCYTPECNRLYIGAFGGGIYSDKSRLSQLGTAFFSEIRDPAIGPLTIDARGHSRTNSSGFGGVQIGYEWRERAINCGCQDWTITPAAEVEAFFYSHTRRSTLHNPAGDGILPAPHDFAVSFPMDMSVVLINGVFGLNSCSLCGFTPYVGGGIGAAHASIRHARSEQVSPSEPDVNHFDSKRGDWDWAFAAQAKAGVSYKIWDRFHVFAEYRFLFVDSTKYVFGSTVAAGHVPTSTWNVEVKNICYNAFAFGVQFDL